MTREKPQPPFPYNARTGIRLPAEIDQELLRLLAEGRKVEAVSRVLKLTGAGLRLAKEYVDRLGGRP